MKKKYTVFISSTYIDLKEERKKVLDVVLKSDFIPIGMEYFNAADEEQFSVIKKLIDDSDFYVLIIGGRYGSTHPITNISYTEMEYDYAIEKGVPVLVFECNNVALLSDDKKDSDLTALNDFKMKAKQKDAGNRMAQMWTTHEELMAGVIIALNNAVKDHNRPGWIRGSEAYEWEALAKTKIDAKKLGEIKVSFDYSTQNMQNGNWAKGSITATLDEVFKSIAIKVIGSVTPREVGQIFIEIARTTMKKHAPLWTMGICDTAISGIMSQLIALKLFELDKEKDEWVYKLTKKGLKVRDELVLPDDKGGGS